MRPSCEILDGADCYYDGSSIAADHVYDALLREGHDGVWRILEERYVEIFQSEKAVK